MSLTTIKTAIQHSELFAGWEYNDLVGFTIRKVAKSKFTKDSGVGTITFEGVEYIVLAGPTLDAFNAEYLNGVYATNLAATIAHKHIFIATYKNEVAAVFVCMLASDATPTNEQITEALYTAENRHKYTPTALKNVAPAVCEKIIAALETGTASPQLENFVNDECARAAAGEWRKSNPTSNAANGWVAKKCPRDTDYYENFEQKFGAAADTVAILEQYANDAFVSVCAPRIAAYLADLEAYVYAQTKPVQVLEAAKEIFQDVNANNGAELMRQNLQLSTQPTAKPIFTSDLEICTVGNDFEHFDISAADCALPEKSQIIPTISVEDVLTVSELRELHADLAGATQQPICILPKIPETTATITTTQPVKTAGYFDEPDTLATHSPTRLECVENFSYENPTEIIEHLRETFAQTPKPQDPEKGEHFGFALHVNGNNFRFFYTKTQLAHTTPQEYFYTFSCFWSEKNREVFRIQTSNFKKAFTAYSLLHEAFFKNLPLDATISANEFDTYKDPETLTTGEIISLFEWGRIEEGKDSFIIQVGQTEYKVVGWNDAYSLLINKKSVMHWVIDENTDETDILAQAYQIIYKDICQISPYKHAEKFICLHPNTDLSDTTVKLVENSLLIGINRASGAIVFNARATYDTSAQNLAARQADTSTPQIVDVRKDVTYQALNIDASQALVLGETTAEQMQDNTPQEDAETSEPFLELAHPDSLTDTEIADFFEEFDLDAYGGFKIGSGGSMWKFVPANIEAEEQTVIFYFKNPYSFDCGALILAEYFQFKEAEYRAAYTALYKHHQKVAGVTIHKETACTLGIPTGVEATERQVDYILHHDIRCECLGLFGEYLDNARVVMYRCSLTGKPKYKAYQEVNGRLICISNVNYLRPKSDLNLHREGIAIFEQQVNSSKI